MGVNPVTDGEIIHAPRPTSRVSDGETVYGPIVSYEDAVAMANLTLLNQLMIAEHRAAPDAAQRALARLESDQREADRRRRVHATRMDPSLRLHKCRVKKERIHEFEQRWKCPCGENWVVIHNPEQRLQAIWARAPRSRPLRPYPY